MNKIIKASVLPVILAIGTIGTSLLAIKTCQVPIFYKILGVGAGSNVISGKILDNGSAIGNTVGGAATGAVVNATHKKSGKKSSLLQDSAVGAATNLVTGAVIGNGHTGKNAISGAADGALINILK